MPPNHKLPKDRECFWQIDFVRQSNTDTILVMLIMTLLSAASVPIDRLS
jgi:hypothetical protein